MCWVHGVKDERTPEKLSLALQALRDFCNPDQDAELSADALNDRSVCQGQSDPDTGLPTGDAFKRGVLNMLAGRFGGDANVVRTMPLFSLCFSVSAMCHLKVWHVTRSSDSLAKHIVRC
jgi:hypothetical protein